MPWQAPRICGLSVGVGRVGIDSLMVEPEASILLKAAAWLHVQRLTALGGEAASGGSLQRLSPFGLKGATHGVHDASGMNH